MRSPVNTMKNDIYALLYSKGTRTGENYAKSAQRRKKILKAVVLGLGLPLLLIIGYQYLPGKFSREVTVEDSAAIERTASEKKLEAFYSNAGLYNRIGNLGQLENAFLAGSHGDPGTKNEKEIAALVKNGADVLAYHCVGRVLDGKVADYNKNNFSAFSRTVRAVTRNPGEFLEDLNRSRKKGRGTIIALIGSGREHYNILPDASTDPNCSAGILMRFAKEHPEYSGRLKVIFFHPYTQDALFGQPEYEDEKIGEISRQGWKNAFLGVDLGSDDLAKPLVTENGWQNGEFWAEGPGIVNFSAKHVLLEKTLTASRLKAIGKGANISNFYWLPWGTIPKNGGAVKEIAGNYELVFAGYSGAKFESRSPRIIPARIMESK